MAKAKESMEIDNFKSTADLTSNPGFQSSLSIASKNVDEKPYNPFEHRTVEHPNSTIGSIVHLLKCCLGSGILAMPAAFKNSGLIVGAIGTLIAGFVCTHTVHILVKTSQEVCVDAKKPSLSFAETCGAAFTYGPKKLQSWGNSIKVIVDYSMVVTYFSVLCVYVVFIGSSMKEVMDVYMPDNPISIQACCALTLVPLVLICQIRNLKYLVPFSALANILILVVFVITLYYVFVDLPPLKEREMVASITQWPLFLSTVIFAMEGIGVVMPVENEMAKPQQFLGCPGVLNVAMVIVISLYGFVGFFGYVQYGDLVKGSITLNLPEEDVCWASDVNPRYVPHYHVYPPSGWMNDPNGFCIFEDEYHLFYQYNPYSSQEPGVAHWGHVKSPDLINWEHLPTAMTPDQPYDINGVFSGSAIVENGTMYLLYTGNVNNPTNKQVQALAESQDGISVVKYPGNPVIEGAEFQPNIRDPKVWKHGDLFYMVLGNSFDDNTRGRVLLYSSPDLISWTLESVLDESDGSVGHVWECPDFFELDGKYVLLFSPQGMQAIGDKYKNFFQTGYVVGNFDYETKLFTPITEFRELDHGHDFYATQTILDGSGRRVFVAWFDMWESVHPERNDGWSGQITIPRELELTEGLRLLQKPVKELDAARGPKLRSGKAKAGYTLGLEAAAADIRVTAPRLQDFELLLESDDSTLSIKYDYKRGTVTLDRGGDDGVRRTKWRPEGNLVWQVLVDSSSVELFCGKGEVTFSSRFFPNGGLKIRLGDGSNADDLTVYKMLRTIKAPGDN